MLKQVIFLNKVIQNEMPDYLSDSQYVYKRCKLSSNQVECLYVTLSIFTTTQNRKLQTLL